MGEKTWREGLMFKRYEIVFIYGYEVSAETLDEAKLKAVFEHLDELREEGIKRAIIEVNSA